MEHGDGREELEDVEVGEEGESSKKMEMKREWQELDVHRVVRRRWKGSLTS